MGDGTKWDIYQQVARVGKVLASPVRLRLLDLLGEGEQDVEGLARAAGVGLKNTSAQLQVLRASNLVSVRRQGTRSYYKLAGRDVFLLIAALQTCAEVRLADLRSAVTDLLGDMSELEPVTADELRDRLSDPGVIVIDVRSAREYSLGHIPGAVSVPAAEVAGWMGGLPGDREVIAYCHGPYCVLSPDTVRFLRAHGIDAHPLTGGMTQWLRHDNPTETGGAQA
ncbi:ArsR/SmtB family transcription factor [Actinoplanes sp. NPDC051494]|uniref:ArsR/SmtB family transcription factor n=1 Tax=Actinoplanes sp. NPDC051494 TaxID=3363907 RepID=UPI0037A4AE59